MRNILKVLAAVILVTTTSLNANAQNMDNEKVEKYKVVFQLSSDDTLVHKSLVKQLDNLTDAITHIEIEIVMHGPGVSFAKNNSRFALDIQKLYAQGIKFLVCRNTLKEKKIKESELLPVAEIIPAGLAHIIKRQAENWSYVKAGF